MAPVSGACVMGTMFSAARQTNSETCKLVSSIITKPLATALTTKQRSSD